MKKVFINMGFIDKTCVQGTCSTSGRKLWRRQPRTRSRTICMIIIKLSLCQKVLTVRYIWKEAIFLFCKQLSYWLIEGRTWQSTWTHNLFSTNTKQCYICAPENSDQNPRRKQPRKLLWTIYIIMKEWKQSRELIWVKVNVLFRR